jgi:hypothetical protein
MNNNRPSYNPLVKLALLALLASSVACAHGPTGTQPGMNATFAVGPGGKGISQANDFSATRSAPNFADKTMPDRSTFERVALPPVIVRR